MNEDELFAFEPSNLSKFQLNSSIEKYTLQNQETEEKGEWIFVSGDFFRNYSYYVANTTQSAIKLRVTIFFLIQHK